MVFTLKDCLFTLHRLRDDPRAVTGLEYGLIAALIAIAIVTSVGKVGTNLSAEFTAIAAKL
jgi:pilus assembly protein Flp/PilA